VGLDKLSEIKDGSCQGGLRAPKPVQDGDERFGELPLVQRVVWQAQEDAERKDPVGNEGERLRWRVKADGIAADFEATW